MVLLYNPIVVKAVAFVKLIPITVAAAPPLDTGANKPPITLLNIWHVPAVEDICAIPDTTLVAPFVVKS